MSAITAKASRKMKKYAVLTREPRCFLGSFDFSWEQRKFGEITSKYENPVPTPHDGYYRLGIRSHAKGTFHSYVAKGQELETAQMHRVAAGNFIVNITFGWEHAVAITDKNDAGKLVSHRFPQFSFAEGMVPEFFRYVIVDEKFRHHLWLASPGGAGRNRVLKLDEMLNYLMRFPSRDEQIKIAEFFRHLDNLITLHQRKCALLFSPFQAFISMMFTTSTFSWEQRKLSEITDKVTEKNAGLQYVETFTNSAEFGIISQRDFFDHDIAKLGSLDGYYIVKTEDFVYNPRISTSAPVGPINRNKLGRTGVMSPLYTVFRPHDIDTTYLEYFFKCGYWHSFMNFNGDSGARSDRFSIRDNVFFQMPIPIPDIDEQRKIGELLTCLDNLITLHQRKCIFFTGRAGRLISTVNKKRITPSWEQRKLASLCEKFTDGDWIESKDQSDFGVRLVQTGNVGVAEYLDKPNNKKWISEDTFDRLHCEEVLPGDILISRLPEPAGRACIVPLLGTKMITAVDCTIVRTAPDMSNKFLVQYLSSQAYFDDVNTCLAGGTRQRISRGNLANFNVPIPVKKSEQDAIGMFFGYLDNLITLHQRKPFLMKWRTSDANRNQTNRLVL